MGPRCAPGVTFFNKIIFGTSLNTFCSITEIINSYIRIISYDSIEN